MLFRFCRHALASHPPVDLVQEYFACKSTVYDALFTSIGIASGNTATFVPIFMLVLLPLIYLYLSSSGNLPPKKEYDEEVGRGVLTDYCMTQTCMREVLCEAAGHYYMLPEARLIHVFPSLSPGPDESY